MADKTWARIVGGAVFELIVLDAEVVPAEHMPADLAAEMVDVTTVEPAPQQGWVTRDEGKTFAAPVLPPDPPPRSREATTYQIMSVFSDAERAAYANVKAWDQQQFSARSTAWPETNEKIGRIAAVLGTKPASLFDRALGAEA